MDDRNVTIYFVSGTGNSFRVASWISECCNMIESMTCAVLPIERSTPDIEVKDNPADIIPALPSRSVEKIISRSRLKVEAFAMRILSGRSNWWTLNNLYEFMFGILLLPVTALYLVLGRFYLPKLFFANNGCNGCGRCAENCPAGGIRMVGRAVASVAG